MSKRQPPQIVCGPPGSGKSYYIKKYAEEHSLDVLVCPCRIDRTLREQRTKLHEWAHRLQNSLLWLEGADDLTPEAQSFLRRILETYSPNVHFILECRTIESIQEPIRSRCMMKLVPLPTKQQLLAHGEKHSVSSDLIEEALKTWPASKCTWRQVENLAFQEKENIPLQPLNMWNDIEKVFLSLRPEDRKFYLQCRHLGGNPFSLTALHCNLKKDDEKGDGE
jgi:hypothetical protein